MKKALGIIFAVCLIVSVLFVTVLADDEPARGVVLRVSALKKGNIKPVVIEDYTDFDDGWNAAMDFATSDKMTDYSHVVVDLYADWEANADGEFTDDFWGGTGFYMDTLYVPSNVRLTLNMHGHTINRDLQTYEYDGEVMYINSNAEVVINNGTIKGGFSCNGAGGIHIMDNAKVTLNNVHIVGNIADTDDGGGIAIYKASLTMNGGSFTDNAIDSDSLNCYGGALYAYESVVILNNVEFKNNQTISDIGKGAAIYAEDSTVSLDRCTFDGNGIQDEAHNIYASISTIHGSDSLISVKNSTFINNGGLYYSLISHPQGRRSVLDGYSSVFYLDDTALTMKDDCKFSNNTVYYLIATNDKFNISDSTFTNNESYVFHSFGAVEDRYFSNCTFHNNKANGVNDYSTSFDTSASLSFHNCSMGNSTFSDKENIKITYSDISEGEAVLRASILLKDGTTVFTQYYKDFTYGWNDAMGHAKSIDDYDRIIIDLYADWNAKNGDFSSSGDGFIENAIYFLENAKITLNMNGHTINRGKTIYDINGEVMYIGEGADVIINNGSIKGGFSLNGAGGIHIKGGAKVVLNNINVVENTILGTNGAGIAVHAGATLIMNGGSISNNRMYGIATDLFSIEPYGTLYVNNATATLNNVTISNNNNLEHLAQGAAIYANYSTVTITGCVVSGNGLAIEETNHAKSVIAAYHSKLTITNTDFTDNAANNATAATSRLFYLEDSRLTMDGGKITGNHALELFFFEDSTADIQGVTATDNASAVIYVNNDSQEVHLTACILGNNTPTTGIKEVRVKTKDTLVMTDCTLGDTTFENKSMVTGVGSIFGAGSLTMIVSITALIASVAAIGVNITTNKKNRSPMETSGEDEDDE